MTKKGANQPEMIPARKLPRYIGVEPISDEMCRVYITKRMANTLPRWILRRLLVFYDPPWDLLPKHRNHVYTLMHAKDELEAYMRFCRLWKGIPSE